MKLDNFNNLIIKLKKDKRFEKEIYVIQNNKYVTGYLLKGKKHNYGFLPFSKENDYWFDYGLAYKNLYDDFDLLGLGLGKHKIESLEDIEDILNKDI